LTQELSTYFGKNLEKNADVDGATSDGFSTTALPAATAPIKGSIIKAAMKKIYYTGA
jgi:hypothetical protein